MSPPIAANVPSVVINPDANANRLGGNQIVAIFNAPTNANAEPNPMSNRPKPNIHTDCAEPNINAPITHNAQAATNNRRGPYRSINTPTTNCMGEYAK